MIKPDSFQAFFDKFRADFAAAAKESPAIALDGKEMHRSFNKAAEQSNLSIVTAFTHGIKLSLGITKSGKAGSEILSLRELVKMLDIRGITITADALHCQRETCELTVQERGEYCRQLKANQKEILKDTRAIIDDDGIEYIDKYVSYDKGYGRIEERSYHVYNVPDHLIETHQSPHLDAFVHVVSKRTVKEETSRSDRIYLFSKCPDAKTAAKLIWGHWEIENSLHWSLDVVMNDDDHRARKDHAPENFAILRRIALNIIMGIPDKGSNRGKVQRAGWDKNFFAKLIQGF